MPLDPFARKMVRGSFVYGAFLVALFALMTVVYLHLRPRCSDQVVSDQTSPDGRWAAAVMEARCGEDQPFVTHVNLRAATRSIKLGYFSGRADEGEVFLLEQDAQSASVAVNWTSANHLEISCTHCQMVLLRKKFDHWANIRITYSF